MSGYDNDRGTRLCISGTAAAAVKKNAIKIDYDNDKETIVTIIAPPLLRESRRRYIVPAGT